MALEAHQCQVERRRGGEAGVQSIEVLVGENMLQGKLAGRWSAALFASARRALPGQPEDTLDWNPVTTEFEGPRNQPAAFLITHRDGLRSAVIMTAGYSGGFSFACQLRGESTPRTCWFKLQEGGVFGHFSYLVQAFEESNSGSKDGLSAGTNVDDNRSARSMYEISGSRWRKNRDTGA
ncbi:MAG UNVERIFIED_CONTAM: hypothetical protein LVR18_25685 [Planctomycetaceae bacterium]|jgi:hypothetical protein